MPKALRGPGNSADSVARFGMLAYRLASRDDTPRRQQCKRCRRMDLASRAIVNLAIRLHAAKLVDGFSTGAGLPRSTD
ncbi:MAG: hypothetical protein U1A77_17465 [Pirellulales bacterium]